MKYSKYNFLTPVPNVPSIEALNVVLLDRCRARQAETAGRQDRSIAERLTADLEPMRALPAVPLEACDTRGGRVNSTAPVRYKGNDYSVPTRYGFQAVLVKAFVDEVVILSGAEEIARQERCCDRAAFIFDPARPRCCSCII